jgi:hypothetical protein
MAALALHSAIRFRGGTLPMHAAPNVCGNTMQGEHACGAPTADGIYPGVHNQHTCLLRPTDQSVRFWLLDKSTSRYQLQLQGGTPAGVVP